MFPPSFHSLTQLMSFTCSLSLTCIHFSVISSHDFSVNSFLPFSKIRLTSYVISLLKGLNKTLQLIGKHNSGNCETCNVPETVEPVLMMCREFIRERRLMKSKIEDSGESCTIKYILSKNSDRRVIKYMFQFLRHTGIIYRI